MIEIKQKKLVFSVVTLLLFSCNSDLKQNKNKTELTLFDIQLPEANGNEPPVIKEFDEGYRGVIKINDYDTIYFNFGIDINNLSEIDPSVIYYPYENDSLRKNLDTSLVDPTKIIYTKKQNFDIDEFRKQNVNFSNISGFSAKITFPRNYRNGGITGVYFDSLGTTSGGRIKFNCYSKISDSINSKKLIESINTIKFKKLN